jgi:D-beta-D-heptose 7-phosphate kinase / D-beta-D-heptose 1-phosphate adenosyltransferase
MSLCVCNGCFDGLHPGHLFLLGYAAAQADDLVVGVNSDLHIRRTKGREPWFPESERIRTLEALGIIRHVVVFEDDPSELVLYWHPEVYCVGAEYRTTYLARRVCEGMGVRVVFVPRVGSWASRNGPGGLIRPGEEPMRCMTKRPS